MSGNRFICPAVLALALLLLCPWPKVSAAGVPSRGEALFVGSSAFANGGAPCLACHSLTGVGLSAGASYGPDLSAMYQDYGAEGVAGVLESLEFPSMAAIYVDRPLSDTEQADLLAYFEQTAELSQTPASGLLALQVGIGVLVLLALTLLVGRRRMRAVRQPLIDRQRNLINKGGLL
jgi:cytochrome c553